MWDPPTVPMPAASPATRRAPIGRLDPVENICKSLTGGEEPCRAALPVGGELDQAPPTVGDGRHRRAYLQAARSEGWGQAGARCGQRTMVCAEGGTVRIAPQLCDTWACKVCGPRRVAWLKRQLGAAVERHGLDQFWTLTIWTETCTPVESFEVVAKASNYLAKYCVQQATLRQDPAWAQLAGKRMFSKSRDVQFEPFRTRSEDAGGAWEVWERPYWDAAAKLRSVAPVACERVAGVPSLTVRAAGGLVGGVPACLVVESAPRPVVAPPSAASAEFCPGQNIPCSLPDPVFLRGAKDALLRVLHGGHTGPPRREKVAASIPSWMGGVPSAHPPHPGSTHAPQGEKGGA